MKKIFTICILILLASACGKENTRNSGNTENAGTVKKNSEKIEEINLREVTLNDMENVEKVYREPKKAEIYLDLIYEYTDYIYDNSFFFAYFENFLDEKNNLKQSSEINQEEISNFSRRIENIDYKKLKERIREAEDRIDREPQLGDIDETLPEFLKSLKEELKFLDEIREYYSSEKNIKEDYEKGRKINERYFEISIKSVVLFKEFYRNYQELKYAILKHYSLEMEKKGYNILADINNLYLLNEMFVDYFSDWKGVVTVGVDIGDSGSRVKNLKKLKDIQFTIKKIYSELDKNSLKVKEEENVDLAGLEKFKSVAKENIELGDTVIRKLESEKGMGYEEMLEYSNNRTTMGIMTRDEI